MAEHHTGSPDEELRIGPYDVIGTIVVAPGGRFIEARDGAGERRLLQVVQLRAPRTREEENELAEYVRMVATATAHFDSDPDVRVLGHGAAERPSGAQVLYWALPWKEEADRLGRASQFITSPEDLIEVAISILERIHDRHERGRLDPLLSEHLVIVRASGGAVVAGVPIHLPPEWIASDASRARLAPEEMLRFEPTRGGDLWRAGQTIRALASLVEPVPAAIRRIIDALADPDPELRMSDPVRAIRDLKQQRNPRARADNATTLLGEDLGSDRGPGDIAPRRVGYHQSDDLPSAESLQSSFEADRTDRLNDQTIQDIDMSAPLANMRSAAPVITAPARPVPEYPVREKREDPSMAKIAEAPTILEMKPPQSLRAKAADALERRRRRLSPEGAPGTAGDPNAPGILAGDTLVDEQPTFEEQQQLTGEEPTIDGGLRRIPPSQTLGLNILDPVEAVPTAEEPPARDPANTWDRAKLRAVERARAGMKPAGPSGTVVGVRDMGPAGTLVGINPVRGRERLGDGRPEPKQLGPGPDGDPGQQQRGGTVVGVPSLRFRGRDALPEDADALPISPPAARAIAGLDTGDFEAPQARPRTVSEESSDVYNVHRGLANRSAPPDPAEGPEVQMLEPAEMETLRPQTGLGDVQNLAQLQAQQALQQARIAAGVQGVPGPGGPGVPGPGAPGPGVPGPGATPSSKHTNKPIKRSSWKTRVPLAILLLLALALGVVFAGRQIAPGRPKKQGSPPRELIGSGEVTLTVAPREAIVIGEEDGRILGESPVYFQMPAGGSTAVLITAKDREPQRLVLPERGSVNVLLRKLSSTAKCEVALMGTQNRRLEGVAAEVSKVDDGTAFPSLPDAPDTPQRYRIPGAAVIRAVPGGGAWFVTCPELGGNTLQTLAERPVPAERRLHVVDPPNSLFFFDNRLGGATPFNTTLTSGFVMMRVEAVDGAIWQRWVPVFWDIDVRLPPLAPRGG